MADVLDVQNAIADAVSAVVVPLIGNEYQSPEAIDESTFGPFVVPPIRIGTGTIMLRNIMTRLEAGQANIDVTADDKWAPAPQYAAQDYYDTSTQQTVALTISQTNNTVTIGGAIQVGDVIGVQLGALGAGYAVQSNDTFASIATALAALANTAGITCTPSGATITVSGPRLATFSVGTTYYRNFEVWRRRKPFYVTLYAANVYDRQYIGRYMESSIIPATRFSMPDGTIATVIYCDGGFDTQEKDNQQRDMTYIRRMRVLVDFISTQQISATQVVAVPTSLTVDAPGTVLTQTPTTASQL